jgi:hypothetical protein
VDDNLTLLALEEYAKVSGLNVNINKTTAVVLIPLPHTAMNSSSFRMNTPDHVKHFGLDLGKLLTLLYCGSDYG